MKLGLISSGLVAIAALALAGCSGSTPSGGSLFGNGNGNGNNNGADGGAGGGGNPPAPPHALGTILLGEEHSSGSASSTPIVVASFVPDASILSSCTTTVAGCKVPMQALCDGKAGPLCQETQVCTLDASCKATCTQACTLQCATDEVCYWATPTSPACRKDETFNAGALAFAGTTTPMTLFPPYSFSGSGSGSPFLAGAQIEVQGSGSTGAGFAAFDEKFTATTFMQTSPSLSKLKAGDVFGPSGFAVGWQAGHDTVVVDISGPSGTAQCPANDSAGTFTVPAAVVTAISGTGTPSLTISVSRQRVEEKTDAKTQGTLVTATVQPVGYLDLTTVSSESFTVVGCSAGETMCNGVCVDLLTSSSDCGQCGNSCGTSYCSNGSCFGTTCSTPLTTCSGKCVNLKTSATNCGFCGNKCTTGVACVNGSCGGTCGSMTSCSDGCQNLQTSNTDCGFCGNACPSGQSCSAGTCTGTSGSCSSCEATAESGACSTSYSTCADDANCGNYESCMSGCASNDTTCQNNCYSSYPTGASEAQSLQSCICKQQCPASCATDSYCTQTL